MRILQIGRWAYLQVDVLKAAEQPIDGIMHAHDAVTHAQPREPPLRRLIHQIGNTHFAGFEIVDQPVIVRAHGNGRCSRAQINAL